MTHKVKSYIPELHYAEEKQDAASEPCSEDFAVVDLAGGYRVLACRAAGLSEGDALPDVWRIPSSELDFLERAQHTHPVLIHSERGVLICFGGMLASTGLLMVARSYLSVCTLLGVFRYLRRTDCQLSPSLSKKMDTAQAFPDEDACRGVERLLYYMDRMLTDGTGLWQRCFLAARFAGCRLTQTHPIPTALSASKTDGDRLTLFLLCTMLWLRQTSGAVHTPICESSAFSLEVEIDRNSRQESHRAASDFPFLKHPAFRAFSLSQTDAGVFLETLLHPDHRGGGVHAFGGEYYRLHIAICPIAS